MAAPGQTENKRLALAKLSLDGLSIGDAFGQQFFSPGNIALIGKRQAPPPIWRYTDDTAMAVSVVQTLKAHRRIDQDDLAQRFADSYDSDPGRGYGGGAARLLSDIARGTDWREAACSLFDGEGSMGNGGAMRVPPIGAYFADDLARAAKEARLSAEVTHAHPEGQAGAVATAIGAALAVRYGRQNTNCRVAAEMFETVIAYTPDSLTRTNLVQARTLPKDTPLSEVVATLGNGSRVLAYDTVPFCLWCAFHHLDDFAEALWTCVSAGGDVDTTSAIVGGIVACAVGRDGIPHHWCRAREGLPISV